MQTGTMTASSVAADDIDIQYERLLRSLSIGIEEAFAAMGAAFASSSAADALDGARGPILQQLEELSGLLRGQGDMLLCLPDDAPDDADLKGQIAELRKRINQITSVNAKVVFSYQNIVASMLNA